MLITGIILVILASILHCWYAANTAALPSYQAMGYMFFGGSALLATVVLLIAGSIAIWIGSSFLACGAAIIVYIFVLPLVIMPYMRRVYIPAPPKAISDIEWERVAGLRDAPLAPANADAFESQLSSMIRQAVDQGKECIDINAGELHSMVGGYPGREHRMPVCCRVMKNAMRQGDLILQEPPKGAGASVTIRYMLPPSGSKTQ